MFVNLFKCPFPVCHNKLSNYMVIWHHHHSFSWDIARGNNKSESFLHLKKFNASGVKLHGLSNESAYVWTIIITIIKTPEKSEDR